MDVVDGEGHRWPRWWAVLCLTALMSGCALFRSRPPAPSVPPPSRVPPSQVGIASWYGPGFNGKPTASGEIYDEDELTAASTTLPLGTLVLVTNLENGRSVQVRINDRGPFVKGRKMDLSRAAAMALKLFNPGTARVRINVLHLGPPMQPAGYFVQVGSFSDSANAFKLSNRLGRFFPDVRVERLHVDGHSYYRVRMGAFADHAGARARATQTARLGLPSIIERQ